MGRMRPPAASLASPSQGLNLSDKMARSRSLVSCVSARHSPTESPDTPAPTIATRAISLLHGRALSAGLEDLCGQNTPAVFVRSAHARIWCVGGARGGCMMMEKRYETREHDERGAVTVSVPEDFTDLSTVHHSLGSLSVQVNALRLEVY